MFRLRWDQAGKYWNFMMIIEKIMKIRPLDKKQKNKHCYWQKISPKGLPDFTILFIGRPKCFEWWRNLFEIKKFTKILKWAEHSRIKTCFSSSIWIYSIFGKKFQKCLFLKFLHFLPNMLTPKKISKKSYNLLTILKLVHSSYSRDLLYQQKNHTQAKSHYDTKYSRKWTFLQKCGVS